MSKGTQRRVLPLLLTLGIFLAGGLAGAATRSQSRPAAARFSAGWIAALWSHLTFDLGKNGYSVDPDGGANPNKNGLSVDPNGGANPKKNGFSVDPNGQPNLNKNGYSVDPNGGSPAKP